MVQITITLTDTQFTALNHEIINPEQWFNSLVSSRANDALQKMYAEEIAVNPAAAGLSIDAAILQSSLPTAAQKAIEAQAAIDAQILAASRNIKPDVFRSKFTFDQLAQIYDLALTDANVKVLLMETFTSQLIELDSQKVKDGLNYLISVGVNLDLTLF